MRRLISASVFLFASGLAAIACHSNESAPEGAPPAGVNRCIAGINLALDATTLEETNRIYYEECADLYTEKACHDASRAAAHAAPDTQLEIVATGCKKAYCPTLGSYSFDICKDGFVMSQASLVTAWPPLFGAILAREAGSSATDITNGLLSLYAHTAKLLPAPGSASAGTPSPPVSASGAPPSPPSSASAGAPPGSSSAALPPTAGPPGAASAGAPGAAHAPRKR